MEYSRGNKKAKPKVEIHDLLNKHSTNGIRKLNPYLHFRDLASFCNAHTSDISNENKLWTLGMFQQFPIPYCKKIQCKATYEEAKNMVNIFDKAIKNPDQVQEVSTGEKGK